jgi:hypothetical protein
MTLPASKLAIIGLGCFELLPEMVASDLVHAQKQALRNQHGYKVSVSVK